MKIGEQKAQYRRCEHRPDGQRRRHAESHDQRRRLGTRAQLFLLFAAQLPEPGTKGSSAT